MIVYGALVPHPPLIIPAIGREQLSEVRATVEGMRRISAEIAGRSPDRLVIITPHGNVFRDAVSILASPELSGDLARFGQRSSRYAHPNDLDFLARLKVRAEQKGIPTVAVTREMDKHGLNPELDHGVLVPLHYLEEAGLKDIPLLAVSVGMLAVERLYLLGRLIREVADQLDLKTAVIASGDMSHRLKDDGPYSYHPEGPIFDKAVREMIEQGETLELLRMKPEFRENAGECGYRSLVIMLGSLEGQAWSPQIFSYEGPFGVGYLVAGLKPEEAALPACYDRLMAEKREERKKRREKESVLVQWARRCLEEYVTSGRRTEIPQPIPPEMQARAAAFVSLKKDGQLRGCIGTLQPVRDNLAVEIRENAISAASEDYRFPPVEPDELDDLVYSVDILSPPEPIEDISQLDPKRYGVIVRSGGKSGVLLPDLEGIDTPEQQVEIARQKAGIRPGSRVSLERFEVRRFH